MNLLKVVPVIKLTVRTAFLCSASRVGKGITPGKAEMFTSSSQVGPGELCTLLPTSMPGASSSALFQWKRRCTPATLILFKYLKIFPSKSRRNYMCVYKKIWFHWINILQYSSGKSQSSIIFMRTMNTQPEHTYTRLCDSLMIVLTDL